jgi:hypothetical protein
LSFLKYGLENFVSGVFPKYPFTSMLGLNGGNKNECNNPNKIPLGRGILG